MTGASAADFGKPGYQASTGESLGSEYVMDRER